MPLDKEAKKGCVTHSPASFSDSTLKYGVNQEKTEGYHLQTYITGNF